MKFIGISQNIEFWEKRNEFRDCIDQSINKILIEIGLIPVPIPNSFYDKENNLAGNAKLLIKYFEEINLSGFILSGGNDLGSYPSRDLTELAILDYAAKLKLPVLGICRGMLMMAKWAGTQTKKVNGHVGARHQISGQINGEVNSFHNFSLDSCPKGFKVNARSADGEIEAVKSISLPMEGWMWHPERESPFAKDDLERINNLFQ